MPPSDKGLEESFDRMLMNTDVSYGQEQSEDVGEEDNTENSGTTKQDQSLDKDEKRRT